MNTLDLYKFVTKNNIEYHWHDDDVILMINNYLLDEWNKLLGIHILDEEGLSCVMKDGYFCFQMQEICDHFDIDIKEIFEKEK
jgi:hypothetical protein